MIISACTRPVAASLVTGLLIVGLPATPSLAAADPPTFTSGVDYALPAQDVIAHGDINGDGNQDLITIDQDVAGPSVSVMLGAGDGTFGLPSGSTSLASPPGYVTAGDLNKDGRDDVVVIGEDGMLGVLLGLANGGLTAPVDYASGAAGKGVALGDLNGDGNLDAVTTSYLVNQGDPALSVLLGNGDGTFQPAVGYSEPFGVNAGWLGLADLDSDGDLDAVTSGTTNGMLLWPNKGDGTFDSPEWFAVGDPVRDLALGDLNGDGFPDVVFTQLDGFGGPGFPRVALNNGSGLFLPPQTVSVGLGSFGISLGDVNADGTLDLVTSLSAGGIDLFTGSGNGAFDAPTMLTTPTDAQTQVVADLNRDGALDIAGVNKPSVTVFLNAADPSVTSVAPASGPLEGGTAITIKGTGFLPGTTVAVGTKPAVDVKVVDGATITAKTPAAAAGRVDITVTRTDTKTATLGGAFTYEAPVKPSPPPSPTVSPSPTPSPSPTVRTQRPLRPLNLPARLNNVGTTRLLRIPVRTNAGQNARVRVTGTQAQALGEVRAFRVFRRDGKVWVELSGTQAMRVRVRLHAPKVPGFTAYTTTKVYRTKAVR